jgi:restriction system protein
MGRRRKRDDDWIGLVAQLVGMVFLLSLISPQVRHTISAIGFIAICLLGVVVIALIGFGVYRWATRSQKGELSSTTDFLTRTDSAKAAVNIPQSQSSGQIGSAPQTTAELVERLRSIDWFQFEKLVALVYQKLGYIVTRRGGANPDGGIDLVIDKDGQRWAVQCKQWKTWNVGVKAVREFLGALTDAGIQKGIFITLCGYTGEAKQLASKHGIEIINETGLAQILESTDANLDPEMLAILRDTRKFCPKCENEMVLRTATKGVGAGKKFWGCSAYPKCRSTMPVM